MAEIAASEALDFMQRFAVWMTRVIQPGLVVETLGIHHENFAFPTSGQISEPCRTHLRRKTAAIRENLAKASEFFVEDQKEALYPARS